MPVKTVTQAASDSARSVHTAAIIRVRLCAGAVVVVVIFTSVFMPLHLLSFAMPCCLDSDRR
jgi:hypothetical protein